MKTKIIVHCSATRATWMEASSTDDKVAEIRRWHVADRGWADIGYNYLIDRDGTVANGRDRNGDGVSWNETGAHAKGHNTKAIGICLIGGHGSNENDKFADHFTPEQDRALRNLIADLRAKVGDLKLIGHNEIAAKACPGFDVGRWFARKPLNTAASDKVTLTQAAQSVAGVGAVATGIWNNTSENVQMLLAAAAVVLVVTGVVIFRDRIRAMARGAR